MKLRSLVTTLLIVALLGVTLVAPVSQLRQVSG